MIGRRIEVIADLDRVQVPCGGRVVADHPRVWAGTLIAEIDDGDEPSPLVPERCDVVADVTGDRRGPEPDSPGSRTT